LNPSSSDTQSPLAAAEARVGTALNAKWRLDALLGVGGMGAVYAATNRNGSRAALKVLHVEFAREASIRDRFLREGRIANSVDHAARVVVLDDDMSDLGEPFLVMELLEGETLNQRLRHNDGKLGIEETLRVFDVVLDLLAKCHEASIIHRDIKPANVFLTQTGQIKVLDFGVARMREHGGADATRDGTALGTPSFMAPEQALGLGDMVDGRADLWSVGACIYNALSGVRLHQARTEAEAFVMAATQSAPSIARVAPDLPAEVVAFVDKALAFDRARRFQDAASMRAEMLTLLAAVRTGQLAPTATAKKGVKVRGTAGADDGDEGIGGTEQAVERMLSIGKHLSHAMNGARQYGFGHTHTARCIGQLFEDVAGGLARFPVQWEVTLGGFVYEGKTVWQPDRPPFDRIPFELFADGIRRIALRQGIDEGELRDFIAILMRDSSGFGAEDDTVTALWDRRFEHVAYLAVDAFAIGEDGDEEGFENQCTEIADQARALAQLDRETSLEQDAMGLQLAEALARAGEAAAALAVDGLTKATLGTQLVLDVDRWTDRYLEAFAESYVDATDAGDANALDDALHEWVTDQLAVHDLPPAFKMLGRLNDAFDVLGLGERGRQLEPAIARVMFPPETLRSILSELATEARAADPSGPPALDPAVASGLGRALTLVGRDDGLVATVCQCLDAFPLEGLGAVVFEYAKRWSAGHEAELGAVVARSEPSAALPILRLLGELQTPAALKALEEGLTNPHVDVRLEAIARLPVETDERILAELVRLLEDTTASVRSEALRFCTRAHVKSAGPVLVKHVQSPLFHTKSAAERRQWLDAIAALNARRAEALAIEFLTKVQLIPSEAIEETRVVAADLLATMPSPEGLKAAQDAQKKRWWNTGPVREAAGRAATAIAAALASVAEPGAVKP
jgi:predicted Ser/Thr protein kinase